VSVCLKPLLLVPLLLFPLLVAAQGTVKLARIGWLSAGSAEIDAAFFEGLRTGLREIGYLEGKQFSFVPGFALGHPERLPAVAQELVRLRVDLIVASGDQAALAARKATATIPVVVQVADAVGIGLVSNLARPGGNITGVNDLHADLVPKRLEILKGILPNLSRATFFSNPGNPTCVQQAREIRVAAASFSIAMTSLDIEDARAIKSAFAAMAKDRAEAFVVCGDRVLSTHRAQIYSLAEKNRLPGVYANRRFVDSGGLLSYGTNLSDVYRGLAVYVDRILKGAKPGDLPLQQPTKFEIALNLRAAKAIGLEIPRATLLRADYVVD
jgi:putative ABC transport system substrate-binding protein